MSESLKVWSRFSVTTKEGTVVNLRIVDMPKYFYDDTLNAHINDYIKGETIHKAAGVAKSEEAIEEIKRLILQRRNRGVLHVVICCLDKGDDQIKDVIGVSMMELISNDQYPEHHFKTEAMKKLFEIISELEAHYDEMKAFDLDRCFSDRGLSVCPEYRGLGIAQELLRVRRMICKEHGIPINGAWMTSYGTQKAAERDGWETVFEIQCEGLEKNHGVIFGKAPPSFKFMIARTQ